VVEKEDYFGCVHDFCAVHLSARMSGAISWGEYIYIWAKLYFEVMFWCEWVRASLKLEHEAKIPINPISLGLQSSYVS
jgi:hypothetical protein